MDTVQQVYMTPGQLTAGEDRITLVLRVLYGHVVTGKPRSIYAGQFADGMRE